MIKHIVMFRRRRDVAPDPDREARLARRMTDLGGQIDTVRSWRVSADLSGRPVSWHYVLESSFEDERALRAYLEHALHVALLADLKPYFDLAVVDYAE